MTLAERGLYRELLDHCWECGNLPNSEVVLTKIAHCSEKEFRKSWPTVKAQFYENDGRLYHVKVNEKRRAIEEWHDGRREAGRKGGLAKKASLATSSAKAQPVADLKPSTSTSTSTSSTSDLVEVGDTHNPDFVRAPKPTRAADLNGHTSPRFEEFMERYPRKQNQDVACREWCSVVSIEVESQVFACLENYLASDEVSRAVVKNPDKWLYEQHRNGWKGRWPGKVQPLPPQRTTALEQAIAQAKAKQGAK